MEKILFDMSRGCDAAKSVKTRQFPNDAETPRREVIKWVLPAAVFLPSSATLDIT
jgi:hypothetical protein